MQLYQGSYNDINYKVSNTPGYNSFNGKVRQYNDLTGILRGRNITIS